MSSKRGGGYGVFNFAKVRPGPSGAAGGRFCDLSDNEAQIQLKLSTLISFVKPNLCICSWFPEFDLDAEGK